MKRGYRYYRSDDPATTVRPPLEPFLAAGRDKLTPRLTNPDYLTLWHRRRLFSKWLAQLPGWQLDVLVVGGRILPYKPLLDGRFRRYVAIDPQLEGLTQAVAVGEALPFADHTFDLVICSQVFSYVGDPFGAAREIHRVLRPQGALLLSAPALFPAHHDERWRFLPDGYRRLLSGFSLVDVEPEGLSIAGACRTANVALMIVSGQGRVGRAVSKTLVPVLNLAGLWLDGFSRGNDQLTANYSVFARK